MEQGLRKEQLELMQKCVAKVKETTDILCDHGIRVYRVADISVAAENFGSATLITDLDFREKNCVGGCLT